MQYHPKVCVVILTWNGKKHLEQFLPSVLKTSYPNLEIVIGDNASTDDTPQFLAQNYPDIRVITNVENLGYAGGYNKVLEQIESDYIVLLNSDVEVSSNWIEPVIQLMETQDTIALAQPKIKSWHYKNEFEYAGAAGGFIDKYGYAFCRGRIFNALEDDNGQYNLSGEIFWATGAALFVKRKYWHQLGGFDASFFAHMEEIDLCWRAKNLGLKVMYCAQSTVYHLGGGTLNAESPVKTFLNYRNNLRLLYKNLPINRARLIIAIRYCLDFLALIKFVIEGKFENAFCISKAHVDFIRYVAKYKKRNNPYRNNPDTLSGYYPKSIVFDFFIKKQKSFDSLKF